MHSCGSYFVHVPKIRLAEQLQALSHPAKKYLETKDEKKYIVKERALRVVLCLHALFLICILLFPYASIADDSVVESVILWFRE